MEKKVAEVEIEPVGKDVARGSVVEMVRFPSSFRLQPVVDQSIRQTYQARVFQTRSSRSKFHVPALIILYHLPY